MIRLVPIFAALLVAGATAGVASPHDTFEVAYPDGFREWTHVRSGYIGPESPASARFGGMHNIYANRIALKGYSSGTFPDGSVIVFDVLDAVSDPLSLETTVRKFSDVMEKRGGTWRYSEFRGDSRTERSVLTADGVTQCQGCHTKAKTDEVYSTFQH
ncbi:MAG: cytochrome P460 family protein [Sphingomonas sp.]